MTRVFPAVLPKLLLFCPMILAGCGGCDRGGTAARLEQSIQNMKRYGNEYDKSIVLPVLERATPATLQTPHLLYVEVTMHPEELADEVGPAKLWVQWIGDEPTAADTVLIRNPQTGFEKSIPISQTNIEENQRKARTGVVFRCIQTLEDYGSPGWEELYSQIELGDADPVLRAGASLRTDFAVSPAEAELTKGGKPVSNIVNVGVYVWGMKKPEP